MKLNKGKNKGKVHPSPSSSSSPSSFSLSSSSNSTDPISALNILLPAAILTLISALSLPDREVFAYMISRSLKSPPSFIPPPITTKRKSKKSSSSSSSSSCCLSSSAQHQTQKSPAFDCDCFDCYTAYWVRWDSSPHRELIHQAIEVFEEHLASSELLLPKKKEGYFKLDGNPDPADILSPVDVEGHGTHTSSTLAGNTIPNASLFGLAAGTARGAVPSARIATYKVCWVSSGCSDMDILAAFDYAISDGVDLISISIGGPSQSYVSDSISIGSFHAMRKGILTVGSAGNNGPFAGSVSNHAPWMLSVAASGIDRGFRSRVLLGNGNAFSGVGINLFDIKRKFYKLVNGEDVARNSENKESARYLFNLWTARELVLHGGLNERCQGQREACPVQTTGMGS